MEVIKKYGTIQVTCNSCNSVLKIEPKDVCINEAGQVHHGKVSDCWYYIKCPVCHQITTVDNQIPSNWREEIEPGH